MTKLDIVQLLVNFHGKRRIRDILPRDTWGVMAFFGGGMSCYVETEDGLVWFDIVNDGDDYHIPVGASIHFADGQAKIKLNNAIEQLERQLETLKRIKEKG